MALSFDDASAFRFVINYLVESCDQFTSEEMREFIAFVEALPEEMQKEFKVAKEFAVFLMEVRNGE